MDKESRSVEDVMSDEDRKQLDEAHEVSRSSEDAPESQTTGTTPADGIRKGPHVPEIPCGTRLRKQR